MFEHISSTSNDTVKLLKSLDRKKERQETGLFLAEGLHFVAEAMGNGWTPKVVFADAAAAERPEVADVLKRMKNAGARVLTASEKVLASLSQQANAQDIVAAFHQRLTPLADLRATGKARYVALYEIRDPGNLGTVIRTADAVGAKGVNPRRGIICGDRNSMLAATLEGQGIGITSEIFAAIDLASGRLVKVFEAEVSATFGIYAVCLPRRLNDPLISGTMDWLVREAQTSPDAHPPAP